MPRYRYLLIHCLRQVVFLFCVQPRILLVSVRLWWLQNRIALYGFRLGRSFVGAAGLRNYWTRPESAKDKSSVVSLLQTGMAVETFQSLPKQKGTS